MINTQVSDRIIEFAHLLRNNGHIVGIKELIDSMQTISGSNQPDEHATLHSLRSLCCRNKEEWQQFEKIFISFWHPSDPSVLPSKPTHNIETNLLKQQTKNVSGIAGTTTSLFETMSDPNKYAAGKQNTISKADFRFLNNQHAMREAEDLAEKLAMQLKARSKTHRKIVMKGRRMDIRHTIRNNMAHGGIPLHPVFNIKYKKPPHLVILHDVSHSMCWNNPLLFRFARGLIKACPVSEAFAFHTRLFCVTKLYREKSIQQMRTKLESNNHLWLGGTCIAESLNYFNQHYAKATLRNNAIVIIISDGFDTDAPEYLANQLKLIKSNCKQLLWLNPMLGRETYTSGTKTMLAAKPFVDYFVPAHSVDALRNVIYKIKL
ncbi:MAG: VWA domain-containing protein [marine bacterium B5-7]|nr:MAG: VWA domain-containing protein [marine bacterium B5-7]